MSPSINNFMKNIGRVMSGFGAAMLLISASLNNKWIVAVIALVIMILGVILYKKFSSS